MGKFYQERDGAIIDYQLYDFGDLKLRGPKLPHNRYIAYIGAAQTFGTYCPEPFPNIIGNKLDIGTLNFAAGGAGPTYFLSQPTILDTVNKADLVVVQVMSARSISNSVFRSLKGQNMGIRLSDQEQMQSDAVFNQLLSGQDRRGLDYNFISNLIKETRENYVNSMIELLEAIKAPKILLWFSVRTPEQCEDFSWYNLAIRRAANQNNLLRIFLDRFHIGRRYLHKNYVGTFPHLVTRDIIEQLKKYSDLYVECSTNLGMPQILVDFQSKVVGKNKYYPSPQMHQQVAELLYPVCKNILEIKS